MNSVPISVRQPDGGPAGDNSTLLNIKIEQPIGEPTDADVNFFLRKRYLVCILTSAGVIILMILRTNLSIAIVEMTADKNITDKKGFSTKKAEFDWNSQTKGFVLSVISCGYLFGPVGGILAVKYGGVEIFGLGIADSAAFTVFTPFLVRQNFSVYIFTRILEGVFESFSVACFSDLYVRWAPPDERSRLVIFGVAGVYLGNALNYALSGFRAFAYGWEAIFYATDAITLIWYAFWLTFVSNEPTKDPLMTRKEKNYFKNFIPDSVKKPIYIYALEHLKPMLGENLIEEIIKILKQ